MIIQFKAPIKPKAKARPRVGKYGAVFTPKETRDYEKTIGQYCKIAMGGKPMLQGAINIFCKFEFKVPVSFNKTKTADALANRLKPVGRPDLDNLIKAITDGCNHIAYHDDSQIVEIEGHKAYGREDMVIVCITENHEMPF